MNVALEIPDEKPDENKSAPRIVMVSPKELDPSPFGPDVNPPATPEEELALRESIAKYGVKVPITVGRVGGKGKYKVIKGTRRQKKALELGLLEIPVIIKEYESVEEMRQDAILDNLERRHLPDFGRAELGNTLWHSFDVAEDKKAMAAQGLSPRKRAAIASGLGEGTLASYRYVLDSGNVELIDKMKSGELKISKAASEAKKLTEGKIGAAKTASNSSVTDQMKVLRETFDDLSRATGILRDTVKRGKAVMKLVKKGQVKEPAALIKQMQAVNQSIATLASDSELAEQRNSTSRDGEFDIHTTAASATDMDLPLINPKEGKDA